MKKLGGVTLVATVLLFAGCSSTEPAPAPTVTITTEASPAPTVTVEVTPEAEASEPPADVPTGDVEDSVLASSDSVESVTETEPGRWEVQTSITDPRTDDSAEAAEAIAICEAAVEGGADFVYVLESDGTIYVVYGHPSYGDTCTEV